MVTPNVDDLLVSVGSLSPCVSSTGHFVLSSEVPFSMHLQALSCHPFCLSEPLALNMGYVWGPLNL